MDAVILAGRLTITGGTFSGKVAIRAEYGPLDIAVSGGLFSEDINLTSVGPIELALYGDLELILLKHWLDEDYWASADYAIEGTLRDGSSLSSILHCRSLYAGPDAPPCPGVTITAAP